MKWHLRFKLRLDCQRFLCPLPKAQNVVGCLHIIELMPPGDDTTTRWVLGEKDCNGDCTIWILFDHEDKDETNGASEIVALSGSEKKVQKKVRRMDFWFNLVLLWACHVETPHGCWVSSEFSSDFGPPPEQWHGRVRLEVESAEEQHHRTLLCLSNIYVIHKWRSRSFQEQTLSWKIMAKENVNMEDT